MLKREWKRKMLYWGPWMEKVLHDRGFANDSHESRNHLSTAVSNTLMPVVARGYKLNKATLGWVYFISRVNYTLIKLGLKPAIQDLITQGKSVPLTLSFLLSCLHCSCPIHSHIEQETWKIRQKRQCYWAKPNFLAFTSCDHLLAWKGGLINVILKT